METFTLEIYDKKAMPILENLVVEKIIGLKKQKKQRKTTVSKEIQNLVKPINHTLDIEKLKEERNYSGVNRIKLNKIIKEIDIPQTAEELIAQL